MIATLILSTALVLLANSWGGAFVRIKKAQTNFEAAALLESKMAEVEMKYRGGSLEEIPEDPQENEIDSQYKWTVSSKKFEFPDLTPMFAKGEAMNTMVEGVVKQFTATLSKSVKEVTVTIVKMGAGKGGKDLEYTATTYFIDYDKIGNMGVPSQ